MNLRNRVAILIGGLLALGLFLGGAAGVILEAAKPKRPDQSLLPRFKVVYFLEDRPAVAPIGQIPEGATFYISPGQVTTVADELSGTSSVALDIDNHSKSKINSVRGTRHLLSALSCFTETLHRFTETFL